MMSDRIMALLAFGMFVAFLGVLLWYVPRVDLGAVIAITVVLAAWDFFGPKKG